MGRPNKYNWNEIQKYYDQNNGWQDIVNKFGVSMNGINKARKEEILNLEKDSIFNLINLNQFHILI